MQRKKLMVDFTKAKVLFEEKMPKILIYGPNGINKSRFSMNAPNAIFLDFDKNLSQYPVVTNKSTGINFTLDTYSQVIEFINLLINEPHDFKTVILDSATMLDLIVENQVKLERNIPSVGALPYGEGYHYSKTLWEQILRKLDFLREKRNVMIIMVCHDKLKDIKNPRTGDYHAYRISLNERIAEMFQHWSTVVFYATTNARFKEEKGKFGNISKKLLDSHKVLLTEGEDMFTAKRAYDLPEIIPFDDPAAAWKVFYNHFQAHYKSNTNPTSEKPQPTETKGEK